MAILFAQFPITHTPHSKGKVMGGKQLPWPPRSPNPGGGGGCPNMGVLLGGVSRWKRFPIGWFRGIHLGGEGPKSKDEHSKKKKKTRQGPGSFRGVPFRGGGARFQRQKDDPNFFPWLESWTWNLVKPVQTGILFGCIQYYSSIFIDFFVEFLSFLTFQIVFKWTRNGDKTKDLVWKKEKMQPSITFCFVKNIFREKTFLTLS